MKRPRSASVFCTTVADGDLVSARFPDGNEVQFAAEILTRSRVVQDAVAAAGEGGSFELQGDVAAWVECAALLAKDATQLHSTPDQKLVQYIKVPCCVVFVACDTAYFWEQKKADRLCSVFLPTMHRSHAPG